MKEDGRLVVVFMYLLCLTRAQITFDVQEELQAPLILGNIAVKANITQTPDLEFHLLARGDLFAVNFSTGDFSAIVVLDRESECGQWPRCVINTVVAVFSSSELNRMYKVNVTVLDINDQKPYFQFSDYAKSISESESINFPIKLPTAEDNDSEPAFKVQKYYLQPESHDKFDLIVQRVNKSDGLVDFFVELRLKQKLDRESNDLYNLTLVASDMGTPSNEGRLQVIITVTDENDNSPVFQKPEYRISINESTPINTTVLSVSATDADIGENGRVGYEVGFSGNYGRVMKYFEVDSASGIVKLVSSLQNEGNTAFVFKIKAFDHGTLTMSSEVNVEITIEDTVNDPPSIIISLLRSKNNSSLVPEDALIGTNIAFVDVTDTDVGPNGQTHCTCTSESFSMTAFNSPGVYTISVAGVLDRQKIATHIITIQCFDRGTPPLSSMAKLSVIVEEVNDHPPHFTRRLYEMSVREAQESGVLVGNVFATDADDGANGELRYSLDPSVLEFEINESNGFIYTAVNLDRELKDRYNFSVYAFDTTLSPHTARATVMVNIEDVNDQWPWFENYSYRFLVSENTGTSTVIGKVHATDPDLGLSGMVEYVFVNSSLYLDPPFMVSKDSGAITLTQSLDYETTKLYSFAVTAVDLGSPPRNSSVEVHIEVIDVNDNDPIITFPNPDNLSVTLNLNVTPGQEIIRVIAHDSDHGDNGRLTYSLGAFNSSFSKLFWINQDTGLLTLVAPLTQADVRSYNIVIIVKDNGVPHRATQALLHIEIVHNATESRSGESYTTIVIIMVCVTLLVVVVVLITLCFIKYIDKRKFDSKRNIHKATYEPMNKLDYPHTGVGVDEMDQDMITSPVHQRQVQSFQNQRLGSNIRNGKKCVSFDSAIRSSDTSIVSGSVSTQPDSGFSNIGSTFNSYSIAQVPYVTSLTNTFNPATDEVVNTALQNHNALVRSMRNKDRRPPYASRQTYTAAAGHDADLCSSSSMETTDSGHIGSELDVSVMTS